MRFDLDVSDLDRVRFVVVRRPAASAMLRVVDAVGADRSGVPEWRSELRRRISADLPTLELLRYGVPLQLVEWPGTPALSVAEFIGQVLDSSADDGLPEVLHSWLLDAWFGSPVPPQVRKMVDEQSVVRAAVGRSLRRASKVIHRYWGASGVLLDREERRVAAASTTVAKAALLNGVVPGSSVQGSRLVGSESGGTLVRLADVVELFPLMSGPRASLLITEGELTADPVVISIGYPLPGFASLLAGEVAPVGPSPLVTLLGALRADVLLVLSEPLTMSDLAARVHGSPSRISYHVAHLEHAQLVRRDRHGNYVWVVRTELGDDLVELLDQV